MNNIISADRPGMAGANRDTAIIDPDEETTATSEIRKTAEHNNSPSGYMARLKNLQKERDQANKENAAMRSQLAELQKEISELQTHMVGYISKSMQLEAAFHDEKQARDALSELINRLAD